jgi:hypothetical protein
MKPKVKDTLNKIIERFKSGNIDEMSFHHKPVT